MVILYPQENDSTYNKQVYAESSYLKLNLKAKQEVERVAMWPEVTGKVTPLYLMRKSDLYLPQFKWYDSLRPKSAAGVMVRSDEMMQLMAAPEQTGRHRAAATP